MAQTLRLTNFGSRNIVDQTQLTTIVNTGSNSLPVADSNDFTTGYVLIGTAGSKTAEMVASTNPSTATSVPLSANTTLQHEQYEPVYALFGNQIKVYRAANVDGTQPADSAFTLLQTVNIDPNDALTTFTDATGGGGYWYKCTYFNSTSSAETDLASAVAVRGTFTVDYCSLDDVREEAGFTYAPFITGDMIDVKLKAAQNEIDSTLSPYYTVPFTPPVPAMVSDICKRLAAGLLLQEKYSHINNPDTNGTNKVTQARADLQKIVHPENGGAPLVDASGKSIALPNPNTGSSSWPNADTADSDPSVGGAPRVFRMGMVQGYRSRDF